MNQSDFVAITCNLLKAWEKSRVQEGFGLASHWLKNWREIFKQITKRRNQDRVITFDSHLKAALSNPTALINDFRLLEERKIENHSELILLLYFLPFGRKLPLNCVQYSRDLL